MFSIPKEQIKQLDELNSEILFAARTGTSGGDTTIATLVDKFQRKPWGEVTVNGSGDKAKQEAMAKLLENATGAGRPKTPAELVVENRELRAQLTARDNESVITAPDISDIPEKVNPVAVADEGTADF